MIQGQVGWNWIEPQGVIVDRTKIEFLIWGNLEDRFWCRDLRDAELVNAVVVMNPQVAKFVKRGRTRLVKTTRAVQGQQRNWFAIGGWRIVLFDTTIVSDPQLAQTIKRDAGRKIKP